MSSILTAVFEATIGLLVNKGRDKATERLKEGDVTDQKFHELIVREIDDNESKLDGLARKDLLASISFFKEGIELLHELFQKLRSESENAEPKTQATATEATTETFSAAKRMANVELNDLGLVARSLVRAIRWLRGIKTSSNPGQDESALGVLTNAKERFKDARWKATEAFANEALDLSDRVLAMKYRIMATILETVDNPEDAVTPCRVCIEELHSLSAVKECFTTELKEKRKMMISTVCHANRVVYDVTRMVARRKEHLMLPVVEIDDKKVDPLRDAGVSKVLKEVGMEHCCVRPWSFGEEVEEERKLKDPLCIATNADGQFLIGDNGDKNLKVFDDRGKFISEFHPQSGIADKMSYICAVASDGNNNTYLLVLWEDKSKVQVYNSGNFVRKFPVRGGRAMTVANDKLFILRRNIVHVYELDGRYVHTFGTEILDTIGEEILNTFGEEVLDTILGGKILEDALDITDGPDGQVSILDRGGSRLRVFTEDGHQQHEFNINTNRSLHGPLCHAWHPSGEYVVIAECDWRELKTTLSIYSKDGEYKRVFDVEGYIYPTTVTKEDCIVGIFRYCRTGNHTLKVIVI